MTYKDIDEALAPLGLLVRRIDQNIGSSGQTVSEIEITCIADSSLIKKHNKFIPKRILKSGNRTIVFWQDGTKTIVKRGEDEPDSDYAAFTAALGIKLYGSNSALKKIVGMTVTQEPKKAKQKGTEQTETEPTEHDELERVAARFGMTAEQAMSMLKKAQKG